MIEDKHLTIAKLLLQKGADPNYTDEYGRTALMYAAKSLQEPLVDLFLSHKANRNLVDKVGKSAVDYAKQSRPKSPEDRDKMANYLASAFGFTPELITELQKRSDAIANKL
jgi:ankyrin repeat protein